MSASNTSWQDRLAHAREEGLLAEELFVVLTEPAGDLGKIREVLAEHLAFQRKLEADGVLFAAGPLSDETGTQWTGKGLIILRAASLDEARRITSEDPMHASGARRYTLLPWMMNEGTFTLRVRLSGQSVAFT